MKNKSVKRMLTATLVATMMLASTLTVAASGGSSGSSSSSATTGTATEASTGSGSSTSAAAESVQTYGSNASIKVAGTNVKTTIAGAVDVKTLQGAAIVTPLADVKASLGLTGSQTPYVMVFDTNAKKSNLAMNCVNAAADALGGQVVTAVNVTLGAKENGKLVSLSSGSAGMVVGLPKNADTSKTYYAVCVQPGGAITILKDQDDSASTVTFEVKAGIGTYGIVAK